MTKGAHKSLTEGKKTHKMHHNWTLQEKRRCLLCFWLVSEYGLNDCDLCLVHETNQLSVLLNSSEFTQLHAKNDLENNVQLISVKF